MKYNEIIHKVIQYVDKTGVIGIILYGSHALHRADNLSDMDITVVMEKGKEYFEYIETGKQDLDIAYIPRQRFEKVLEEAYNRSNHSLWLTHSFYLRILATGRIIYDPYNMIKEYKKAIKQWKWTQKDLKNAREHLRETIEYALEEHRSKNILEYIILLGDAINIYLVIKEMMNNKVPSPQPKDLYDVANKYGILKQFITIHRLQHVDERIIWNISRLIDKRKDAYTRRNMKNIKRLLLRRELPKAVLIVRKLFLGIIDQRMSTISNLYNPSLKIKILNNINAYERKFIEKLYCLNSSPNINSINN